MQVAGSRMPRRGQSVVNLDTGRRETMDLDPDPTRVGPSAGVGTHVAAGHSGMSGASLSASPDADGDQDLPVDGAPRRGSAAARRLARQRKLANKRHNF